MLGARAPVALHAARLLALAGDRVIVGDTHRFPLAAQSRLPAGRVRLPPPATGLERYADALARAVEAHRVDRIVPTCEDVFFVRAAHDRWRATGAPAASATVLSPDLAVLARAHDKGRFAAHARALGLDVPRTVRVEDRAGLDAFRARSHGHVFKPAFSRFGSRALVGPQPRRLDALRPSSEEPWIVQECVRGEELCVFAWCVGGRVTMLVPYRPMWRASSTRASPSAQASPGARASQGAQASSSAEAASGASGAAIMFEPLGSVEGDGETAARIGAFVSAYAEATAWTGALSFDFIARADGACVAIECNPRMTSGVHAIGGARAFATAMEGARAPKRPLGASAGCGPLTVPAAMWLYAAPRALREGRWREFRADLARAGDLLDWPGDRLPRRTVPLAIMEMAWLALRTRRGLRAASTFDIEWNGGPELWPDDTGTSAI